MESFDIHEIKKLITAFYNGETTEAEEQQLFHYFNSKDAAQELKTEQRLFLQFYDSADIEMPFSFEKKLSTLIDELAEKDVQNSKNRKKSLWIWISSSAACIAVLFTIGWHLHTPPVAPKVLSQKHVLKDTYTNPQQAYAEAEKALTMVSKNFNKGMDQLNMASSQIEKTNQKVKKIMNHNPKRQN